MAGDRWMMRAAAALVASLCAAPASAASVAKEVPSGRAQVELSYAPLVRKTAPAVVNIYTRKLVRTRQFAPLFDDPFFRRFFGEAFGNLPPQEREQNSLGSGVIVRPDGLVVTNHHVIEGADQIRLVLSDRREFDASVVGTDERTDLAVLRVEAKGEALPYLELMDSDDLEVGDLVLAIGNPFGVGQTVTSGIVSAVARTQSGITDLGSFIQTDAAINPGNSGGALVALDGRLAGINTAIFSKSGGSMGIGFAIPANMVRAVIAGAAKGGKVVRPWLGAWGQAVTADLAVSLGLDRPAGVVISRVHPNGPAAAAGIQPGDVVLGVRDRTVDDPQALRFRIATLDVGGTAALTIVRKGRRTTVNLPLRAPEEEPPRDLTELTGIHPLAGATVANMSPALADALSLDDFSAGVYVLEIDPGSPASRLRFRPGDRVASVNDRRVATVGELKRVLALRVDQWRIAIDRGGRTFSLVINR